jgi:hypothetical protein
VTDSQDALLRPVTGPGTTRNTEAIDYDLWAKNEALRLFDELKHWDAVAQALAAYLKLSGASWWQVSKGERITDAKINALRAHAGLPLLPEKKLLTVCPSCGGDHGLDRIPDCHGAPVVETVCLTTNQVVIERRLGRPVRARVSYLRPCLSREPRVRLAQLKVLIEKTERECEAAV